MLKNFSLFICSIVISQVIYGSSDTLILDKNKEIIQVNQYMYFYADSIGKISLNDVLKGEIKFDKKLLGEEYWKNYPESKMYFFWYAIQIHNPDSVDYANFYFENYNYGNKKLWQYYPNFRNEYMVDSMGTEYRFHSRPIEHKNPLFVITLAPKETKTYYLRIYGSGRSYSYIIVRNYVKFLNYTLRENYEKGLFMGFFVFALTLSFFFFVSLREVSYIYYVFFIAFELIMVLTDGFGFMYYWPNHPEFNFIALDLSRYGLIISIVLFVSYFLELKSKQKSVYYLSLVFILFRTVLYLLIFLSGDARYFRIICQPIDAYILLSLTILIFFRFYIEKKRFILYFFFGHLVLFLGLYSQYSYGSFPDSLIPGIPIYGQFIDYITSGWLVGFYYYITASIHMIFISVALADKIKHLKSDNEQNQAKLIEQLEINRRIQENINKELELKVRERTEEINQQKEEILTQNEELQKQSNELERQSYKISELYTEVTDSIVTSKFIQDSILPPLDLINDYFKSFFVFYKPKDIVSGDFYWFYHRNGITYIAAVDCTGHGVAGAFMSLIGYNLLNQIVDKGLTITPGEILTQLSENLVTTLHQDKEGAMSKDGMDISLCMIDKRNNKIHFAGANNPLYILRNGDIIQIKGDKFGIGLQRGGRNATFVNNEIDIQKDDQFYIFSDGFAGQFGGEGGANKFLYNHFRELLVKVSTMPEDKRLMAIETTFNQWKGNTEQTDDIMVIGFEV
ncbi:MAG: 7TM diverse intracellular signaling domain-containing protein [Bacteroidota bacterium]|nr:7TM diverse intracellular signaling domain-containing protein [Bacteroidota bacterium]